MPQSASAAVHSPPPAFQQSLSIPQPFSVKVVGAAFNAAVRQHLIEGNPTTALESLPVKSEEKGTFSRAQVAKLVRAADRDWRSAILLGYYTGARLSDVANMRWNAV